MTKGDVMKTQVFLGTAKTVVIEPRFSLYMEGMTEEELKVVSLAADRMVQDGRKPMVDVGSSINEAIQEARET